MRNPCNPLGTYPLNRFVLDPMRQNRKAKGRCLVATLNPRPYPKSKILCRLPIANMKFRL